MRRAFMMVFAANAMVFLLVLVAFLVMLFTRGYESADRVWTTPWCYVLAWPISIVVCVRHLRT